MLTNPRALVIKSSKSRAMLYEKAMSEDAEKYLDEYTRATTKENQSNLLAIKKHLVDLKGASKQGWIDFRVEIDDNQIKIEPAMTCEKVYGLDDTDYIRLDKTDNLVVIHTREICDIIAFEYAYMDFGLELSDVENFLKDYPVIGSCKSGKFLKFIKENTASDSGLDTYEVTKGMKIGESTFVDREPTPAVINDYFNRRTFIAKKYNKVLAYSCKEVNSVIMSEVLHAARSRKITALPVMIAEDRLAYIVKEADPERTLQAIKESVRIQAFGRQFIVNTPVEII